MDWDYPLPGFRFVVAFEGLNLPRDMAFQEVEGLEMSLETEDLREGGGHVCRLPARPSHPDLVLKRGLLIGSQLSDWVRDALEDFQFKPLLVTVSLLGESGLPLMAWQAHQAWPVSWSLSGINAASDQVVIETLRLAYARLRLLR